MGVCAFVCGVLAMRFGLARGVKAVVSTILLPVFAFGIAALLLWVNQTYGNGEYRVAIWFLPGLVGPLLGGRDLYRIFKRRREAQEEAEREAERPAYDLSQVRLPPLD